MKKPPVFLLALTILLLAFMNAASGQSEIPQRAKQDKYVHIIKLVNGQRLKGSVVRIDSQQVMFHRPDRIRSVYRINMYGIKSIRIQRKGAGGRGFVLGTFAGGLLGGMITQASYEEHTACNCLDNIPCNTGDVIVGAFGGMLVGGIAGAIIGSQASVKKFRINRDPMAFEKARLASKEFQNQK